MTDAATGEMPAEPVPGLPAPELAADVESAAFAETSDQAPAEHPVGPLRQQILDALLDADEPLSIARILAEMPLGTSRNTCESAIKRCFDRGEIERVAPGTYRLAPPKPAEPPKPAAPPQPEPEPVSSDEWFAWLDDWSATGEWKAPGVPPGQDGCAVPGDIIAKHNDRIRKRLERQRDREAAAARQAAADRRLRDQLLAATNGNFVAGPGLDDVSPIRAAMELVSLDRILDAIRYKTDRKLYPKNEPATSWREPRLLKAVAEHYCRFDLVPRMVEAWGSAGKAPGKPEVPREPENAPVAFPAQGVPLSRALLPSSCASSAATRTNWDYPTSSKPRAVRKPPPRLQHIPMTVRLSRVARASLRRSIERVIPVRRGPLRMPRQDHGSPVRKLQRGRPVPSP